MGARILKMHHTVSLMGVSVYIRWMFESCKFIKSVLNLKSHVGGKVNNRIISKKKTFLEHLWCPVLARGPMGCRFSAQARPDQFTSDKSEPKWADGPSRFTAPEKPARHKPNMNRNEVLRQKNIQILLRVIFRKTKMEFFYRIKSLIACQCRIFNHFLGPRNEPLLLRLLSCLLLGYNWKAICAPPICLST